MIYLYRHIRLDKNEPFYVGIGEDKITQEYQYVRAYDKTNRSKWWKDIAKNGFKRLIRQLCSLILVIIENIRDDIKSYKR